MRLRQIKFFIKDHWPVLLLTIVGIGLGVYFGICVGRAFVNVVLLGE